MAQAARGAARDVAGEDEEGGEGEADEEGAADEGDLEDEEGRGEPVGFDVGGGDGPDLGEGVGEWVEMKGKGDGVCARVLW